MTGDMFVFAYSWQPQFCYGQPTYLGCTPPQSFWNSSFTIHGLWPQYSAGGYPQSCTTEAFDPNVPIAIGWDTMTKYWPDAQYDETDPNYDSFWEHEWTKHGTCTGLPQQSYFQYTIDLLNSFPTPSLVSNNVGGSVNAADLRNAMGGATYASLQCNSGEYLSGVYTCWSESDGKPLKQIECPSDVQKEDTCTTTSVVVRSF